MRSKIFFVEVQDPFHILTTVLRRCYYPVKSHFSAFPPLDIQYVTGRSISNKKEQYGLCTEDEILKEFKRKIRRLYNFVTDSFTMDIEVKPLSMLTTGISAIFSDFRRKYRCLIGLNTVHILL